MHLNKNSTILTASWNTWYLFFGQQARLDNFIYLKNVVWNRVLGRLVCLLLGLPFTAMATAEKQGSVGDGCHVTHPRGLGVLGVSGPRWKVLHPRVWAETSVFKILQLQSTCPSHSCFLWGLKWVAEAEQALAVFSVEKENAWARCESWARVFKLVRTACNLPHQQLELSRNTSECSSWYLPEMPW